MVIVNGTVCLSLFFFSGDGEACAAEDEEEPDAVPSEAESEGDVESVTVDDEVVSDEVESVVSSESALSSPLPPRKLLSLPETCDA